MSEPVTEPTPDATDPAPAEPIAEAEPSTPLEGDKQAEAFDPERALEKIRNLNSEAKNLRERAKAAEAKAAGVDEKDTEIADLRRQLVAARLGLPEELVDRLKGSTPEELSEDAERLLALFTSKQPKQTKPTPITPKGGNDPEADPAPDVKKLADSILGSSLI